VTFCRECIATDEDDAAAAAEAIGYPVIVKADAPDLLHKTEAAAVRLDVRDPTTLRDVVRDFQSRLHARRVVIQECVAPGAELLFGATRDPIFGPLVAVGAGGILAEALADVSLALAPIGADEARAILNEGLRARLLGGLRGRLPVDEGPLIAAIIGVADLVATHGRILEIDVNPVIATGGAALAVDAVIILGDGGAGDGEG
jgi:hypothetical protein